MKIAYQSTVHERVQDLMGSQELTGLMRKFLRNRLIFVFVVVVAVFLLSTTDAVQGALFAMLTGGFYIACAYVYRKAQLSKKCREYLINVSETDESVDAEYEVNEEVWPRPPFAEPGTPRESRFAASGLRAWRGVVSMWLVERSL